MSTNKSNSNFNQSASTNFTDTPVKLKLKHQSNAQDKESMLISTRLSRRPGRSEGTEFTLASPKQILTLNNPQNFKRTIQC